MIFTWLCMYDSLRAKKTRHGLSQHGIPVSNVVQKIDISELPTVIHIYSTGGLDVASRLVREPPPIPSLFVLFTHRL